MTDDQGGASPEMIGEALQLNAKAIEEAQKAVEDLMTRRRSLLLMGRDAKRSYVQMAADASISKAQVYKIVRGGFDQAPLREWAEGEAEPQAALA